MPPAQRAVIETDFKKNAAEFDTKTAERTSSGNAIYEYVLNTFEPVVTTTLLSTSNHYYLLTLLGHYTPSSHPTYLSPKSHLKLSRPSAFNGLRIHTDEISEVIARMRPGTLTIVVVMDSMDWFPPSGNQAVKQIRALNRALKVKGRVMLRSAGLEPWYVGVFEECGFSCRRVASRVPGACIDRYAVPFSFPLAPSFFVSFFLPLPLPAFFLPSIFLSLFFRMGVYVWVCGANRL